MGLFIVGLILLVTVFFRVITPFTYGEEISKSDKDLNWSIFVISLILIGMYFPKF